ncbi:MAG: hypothetical protein COT17_07635 [Elusimicrobia bacterium CG08_land_8_20_14_0_20_51_18]|nr:MAG: hypothetical protein COT17_07635 [Elusimicrobia bacterium CG08_land_8_20_14_0_20_51_18]
MKGFSGMFRYSLVLIAVIFTAVTINIQAIKLGYSIEREEKEIKNLLSRNKYISKRINDCKAPKNVEMAASHMGLKYPEPYSIVMMDKNAENGSGGKFGWLAKIFRFQFGKTPKAG